MNVLILLILFHEALSTDNSLYHHTHNSGLTNGYSCLGDCVNNGCIYDWWGHKDTCTVSQVPSPVFKTIKGTNCYSNCGVFNAEPFAWCATLVDNSISWEYCTRYEARTAIKRTQTDNYLYICTDDCTKRKETYNWCHTHNSWEKCDPEHEVLVFNYPTEKYNDECISRCVLYKGDYKCYDKNKDWKKCYLNPDKSLILFQFGQNINTALQYFGILDESGYEQCSESEYRKKRAINSQWPYIESVKDLVAEFESGFPTIVPNDGGPVQSYTVLPITVPGQDDIIIPLAIRAVITRNHLRPPGTRGNIPSTVTRNIAMMHPYTARLDGNNDERAHLLASVLGGAMEPYNFIPQPRSFNRGRGSRWYFLEGLIARFLRERGRPGRYVDWQMALAYDVYSDRPNRPLSVSLSVGMYEADGTLNVTSGVYENLYFSNNPLWTCRTFFSGSG
ncbi:uncharacterized protein LOC134747084 [Cydia strobilella]|uniref:uncharacterized protein LOC134747084 n=1 Tax=Cydia strobilella TaxID=1100964 RepID=UPI003006A515